MVYVVGSEVGAEKQVVFGSTSIDELLVLFAAK